jgi:replicative DNA helicase
MKKNLSDPGAETAVLAGLFAYGLESYVEVSDIIDSNSFYSQNNQLIYKCVEKIVTRDATVDLPSLLSAADQLGFSETIQTKQELQYIKSLMEFPVNKENVIHFAAEVKKFEFARQIKKLADSIGKNVSEINGDEDIDTIVGMLENPVMEFLREEDTREKQELLCENIEEYIEFLLENQCDQIGLSTGFPRYDAVIGGGLRRKCVDMVAARPGVGKSVWGDNVALHNARKGIPVLMLDTEMSKEDHLNRILSNISGVPINEISTGQFVNDEEKYMAVNKAVEEIKDIPYTYVCVAGAPFENILNHIKRWVMRDVGTDEEGRTNECLVIYDYLKLMASSGISNSVAEFQALGFQIMDLHNLTVRLDIACQALCQLNRDGITREDTGSMSGSDRIVWLVTSLSYLKEKSAEELAEDGPRAGTHKVINLKARHGPGLHGGNYINFRMIGENAKLIEMITRDALQAGGGEGFEGSELPFEEDEENNE